MQLPLASALLPFTAEVEESLIRCSIPLFTRDAGVRPYRITLQRILGPVYYQHLVAYLAYIQTCHTWMEAHPEISHLDDQRIKDNLAPLLAEAPALATFLNTYQERVRNEMQQEAAAQAAASEHARGAVEVQAREARYQALVQATSQAVWDADEYGQGPAALAWWEDLTGQTAAESAGWGWLEALHPEDREAARTAWIQARETLTPLNTVYRIHTHQGDYRDYGVRGVPIKAPDGSFREWIGTFTDITELKRAEAAQREQVRVAAFGAEVGLALAQRDILAEMLHICADAMVRHLGAAFARIWTLNEPEQVLELQASAGLYTHLDGAHSRVPVGALKIGRIAQTRTPHLSNAVIGDRLVPNQEWAEHEGMVAFAGYPLIVERRLVGVMAMFARQALTDVEVQSLAAMAHGIAVGIERKRMENERARLLADEQAARVAAQEAVRVRDAFLSIASHELKNPLTALLGNAQLLQRRAARDGTFSEENQRVARVIVEQAQRMDEMLTSLLDVSRMELGQLTITRTALNVVALLHRVVEEVQPTLEHHLIVWHGDAALVLIAGDEMRLAQVFHNLLHNAVKYSPRGGTVALQITQDATAVFIAVRDQGIGIPRAALPQLFQRFYRAENAEIQRISGTGIGLYVVKEIITLHGGEVSVTSDEGNGSTFTIRLPLLNGNPVVLEDDWRA